MGRRDFHGFGFWRAGERSARNGEFAVGAILPSCRIIRAFRPKYICRSAPVRTGGLDVDLVRLLFCLAHNGESLGWLLRSRASGVFSPVPTLLPAMPLLFAQRS